MFAFALWGLPRAQPCTLQRDRMGEETALLRPARGNSILFGSEIERTTPPPLTSRAEIDRDGSG